MQNLSISEKQMLEMVGEIFCGARRKQSLRRVFYAIYVRHSLNEGRRQADHGQKFHMRKSWRRCGSKSIPDCLDSGSATETSRNRRAGFQSEKAE